jgi:hypothetical protein
MTYLYPRPHSSQASMIITMAAAAYQTASRV